MTTSDVIVHFVSIKHGTDKEILNGNAGITDRLIACTATDAHEVGHRIPCSICNEWSPDFLEEGQR